jgi:hypothetical protein
MNNQEIRELFVSMETAKLAREAGFAIVCSSYYVVYNETRESENPAFKMTRGEVEVQCDPHMNGYGRQPSHYSTYSRPTMSLLQSWLRAKYNIQISTNLHYKVGGGIAGYLVDVSHPYGEIDTINLCGDDYADVLDRGLSSALKTIKLNDERN